MIRTGIRIHDNRPIKKRVQTARNQLLAWYDKHARSLPWRIDNPDPYHVWLSEIMLQQTTVGAVVPYFLKFLKRWPTVQSLARADREEVMKEWAGLGYYARARNLHACAQIVAGERKGIFPNNEAELKKLPGIGDYTAAAIAAIAFNKPATVMDGNIERVMARYFAVRDPLPKSKPLLKEKAGLFFENFKDRPGDLAQAMMDLGATVCIAGKPRCALCPLKQSCEGRTIAGTLPRKAAEKKRPQKYGTVYWITDGRGRVLVHRRPEKGLLGGMAGLPTSDWVKDRKAVSGPDILAKHLSHSRDLKARVTHTFTHFDLRLDLKTIEIINIRNRGYFWVEKEDMKDAGLPTVFQKARRIFEKA